MGISTIFLLICVVVASGKNVWPMEGGDHERTYNSAAVGFGDGEQLRVPVRHPQGPYILEAFLEFGEPIEDPILTTGISVGENGAVFASAWQKMNTDVCNTTETPPSSCYLAVDQSFQMSNSPDSVGELVWAQSLGGWGVEGANDMHCGVPAISDPRMVELGFHWEEGKMMTTCDNQIYMRYIGSGNFTSVFLGGAWLDQTHGNGGSALWAPSALYGDGTIAVAGGYGQVGLNDGDYPFQFMYYTIHDGFAISMSDEPSNLASGITSPSQVVDVENAFIIRGCRAKDLSVPLTSQAQDDCAPTAVDLNLDYDGYYVVKAPILMIDSVYYNTICMTVSTNSSTVFVVGWAKDADGQQSIAVYAFNSSKETLNPSKGEFSFSQESIMWRLVVMVSEEDNLDVENMPCPALSAAGDSTNPPVLYVPLPTELLALDASNGDRVVWRKPITSAIFSPVLASNGKHLLLTSPDEVSLVDSASGEDLWNVDLSTPEVSWIGTSSAIPFDQLDHFVLAGKVRADTRQHGVLYFAPTEDYVIITAGSSSSSGLKGGVIAGIVIGALVLTLALVACVAMFVRRGFQPAGFESI